MHTWSPVGFYYLAWEIHHDEHRNLLFKHKSLWADGKFKVLWWLQDTANYKQWLYLPQTRRKRIAAKGHSPFLYKEFLVVLSAAGNRWHTHILMLPTHKGTVLSTSSFHLPAFSRKSLLLLKEAHMIFQPITITP